VNAAPGVNVPDAVPLGLLPISSKAAKASIISFLGAKGSLFVDRFIFFNQRSQNQVE
jgi:hypothetical protein